MANPLGELNKILKRNNRIELKYFKDLKELDNLRDPSVVIVDSQTEAQQMK